VTDQFIISDQPPPKTGAGRRSYLTPILIILAILVVLAGIVGLMAHLMTAGSFGQGVGVVEIEGTIFDSKPVIQTLRRFGKDDKIKAILLRIDSPGGSVAATQEIYTELLRVRDKKPIIASLGTVAASGGLYVAAAANKIVANPATVTGSIGAIMQTFNIESLLGKVGFQSVVIKSGRYKDIGSYSRPMTPEELALLQEIVNELKDQFVRHLAQGRGLEEEKVAAVADGRIFTAVTAQKLGLVDSLGNFEDAVEMARKEAGLSKRPHLIYPQKKESWIKELIRGQSPLGEWPSWPRTGPTFLYLYAPGL
jgi:protease-4